MLRENYLPSLSELPSEAIEPCGLFPVVSAIQEKHVKPQLKLAATSDYIAKQIYLDLTNIIVTDHHKKKARKFLDTQLEMARTLDSDFPIQIEEISFWIEDSNNQVGKEYRAYLDGRRNGGPRKYFTTKSHALNFLQSIAPTKLVDGSWLYGFARHWDDSRFSALTRIYLEELGDGQPSKNHVVLYKKLLNDNDCNQWQSLSHEYFTQGAIQLALGHNLDDYLPEVIGFNLGYEQLPLHLLITAYELNELDIGPYYFTLHVTVDNAATGHARKSLQGLMDSAPLLGDKAEFFRRVVDGYKLNQLGMSTHKIIDAFDLEAEVIAILSAKSVLGQFMHSDKCVIQGETINKWLSDPLRIPDFLNTMIQTGWIKQHDDPKKSRFWRLIESESAKMYGVFSVYEKQVIHDWIAGNAVNEYPMPVDKVSIPNTYSNAQAAFPVKAPFKTDLDIDISSVEQTLSTLETKQEIMTFLANLISPALHHTPVGLMATRLYKSMLEKSCETSVHPSLALLVGDLDWARN